MATTVPSANAEDRRRPGSDDRRLLHRGDRGRRATDAAPTDNPLPEETPAAAIAPDPATYLWILGILFLVLWGALIFANVRLKPLIYLSSHQAEVAEAFVAGKNYGVFDLNLDMRGLRREHIKRLPAAPEVVVIGASHWQEGRTDLLPDKHFYNAHVHRDYYEDILSVTEMLLANDRLPQTLIISIRDLTFTPIAQRTDYLWLPGLPEYRQMARRLGIEPHAWWETFHIRPWLDLLSLPNAWSEAKRHLLADQRPGPTAEASTRTLDVLNRKGFIQWSEDHDALFTPARAIAEAERDGAASSRQRFDIDPAGVDAIDRLLSLLAEKNVRVVLAHPPFNPVYYETIMASPYGQDVKAVIEQTKRFAEKYGLQIVGSFNPAEVGCDVNMFIDSQHSRPACLGKVLQAIDFNTTPQSN